MDESRWGLKTEMGRRITLPGVNPVAPVVQWHRAHCWLYGAVEVPTGQSLFHAFSHLDAVCFQCFWDRWASHFQDSFNLLQLDRAGAHIAASCSGPPTSCLCFSRRLVPSGVPSSVSGRSSGTGSGDATSRRCKTCSSGCSINSTISRNGPSARSPTGNSSAERSAPPKSAILSVIGISFALRFPVPPPVGNIINNSSSAVRSNL